MELDMAKLKEAVDAYGRKKLAQEMGMPYQTLSHKLGGFSPMLEKDIELIQGALGANEKR